jgi:glycosyltransferase involved in cell wall biosynthesis
MVSKRSRASEISAALVRMTRAALVRMAAPARGHCENRLPPFVAWSEMTEDSRPSITVAIPVYQAERFIAETLESVLAQTHPPDEVIVVDDGSTDGTARELERFRERIRVIRQPNGGCAAAFNTAFREARCDFVAECGADDVWEPRKLERQIQALMRHPQIDVAFGLARLFGSAEGCWGMPADDASSGILEPRAFGRTMYLTNRVCPSTLLIRRSLYERLGPFAEREEMATEDYEYWMRALHAGAVFHYDPEVLVRYRRHDANASSDHLAMRQADLLVHRRYVDLAGSHSLVRRALAHDHFVLGRLLRDKGRTREARAEFATSLRHRPTPRALAWRLLLSVPERHHRALAGRAISLKRALDPRGSGTSVHRRTGARARP